ncbi:hypothetical protein [Streptomyces sp. P9-A2]|uniref:hypothetical protein n=1 Tax=Streptomyces sp. P9-A2 TaxID=3072284 RepID=UPI002FC747F1
MVVGDALGHHHGEFVLLAEVLGDSLRECQALIPLVPHAEHRGVCLLQCRLQGARGGLRVGGLGGGYQYRAEVFEVQRQCGRDVLGVARGQSLSDEVAGEHLGYEEVSALGGAVVDAAGLSVLLLPLPGEDPGA